MFTCNHIREWSYLLAYEAGSPKSSRVHSEEKDLLIVKFVKRCLLIRTAYHITYAYREATDLLAVNFYKTFYHSKQLTARVCIDGVK